MMLRFTLPKTGGRNILSPLFSSQLLPVASSSSSYSAFAPRQHVGSLRIVVQRDAQTMNRPHDLLRTLCQDLRTNQTPKRWGNYHGKTIRLFSTEAPANEPEKKNVAFTFLTGLTMGFFGGIAGLGGGVVCVPMLTSAYAKFKQHQAHGTSLVAVATTGLVGAYSYYHFGGGLEAIDVNGATILAAAASTSSFFGAMASKKLKATRLKLALGIFMITASILIALKPSETEERHFENMELASAIPFYGSIGAVTGFFSGLMGVGGGVIMMPLLSLFGGMDQQMALSTSLLAMVLPSAIAARTHYKLGNVVTWAVPQLLLGTAIGSYSAGFFSTSLTDQQQRILVGMVLTVLGSHTIWKFRTAR